MNENKTELSEIHHYDEIFPPLGNENEITINNFSNSYATPSFSNTQIKQNKTSIASSSKSIINSQPKLKLPPKVRPNDEAGFGTRKIHNGSNSDKNVYLVIPFEDRKYKDTLKPSDDSISSSQRTAVQKIAAKFNVSIDAHINKDKSLGLNIIGKNSDLVSQAKQMLYADLTVQSNLKVSIPSEYHRFIIGFKGEKLREIENRTGTKIYIPRIGEKPEDSNTIIITGNRSLTEVAREELLSIYSEQSKRFQDRINIPKIYYPFLYGPDNRNIEDLRNRTGVRITFPPPNAIDDSVSVMGEREAVAIAINELRHRLQSIMSDCATLPFKLAKSQHQYVAGYRNTGLNEIMEATGVSVEIPTSDVSTDEIILRGPTSQLGPALTLVIRRAESMKQVQLACPNWQHRYLAGRNRCNIERIVGDRTQVYVSLHPTDDVVTVEGPREDVDAVARLLSAEIAELRSKLTFAEIPNVNPCMNKHIVGKGGENITRLQRDYDVTIKLDNGTVYIEGPPEGVAHTKLNIEQLLNKMENETQKDLLIDQRYHRQLIGAQGKGVREIRDLYPNVLINFPNMNINSNVVQLRGPRPDVEEVAKQLETRLTQVCNIESISVTVPAAFHSALLSTAGDNASSLVLQAVQCECGGGIVFTPHPSKTEVALRGPREEMGMAKQLLLELANDKDALAYRDTVGCRPDLHKLLLGRGASILRDLRQTLGVRVVLPNSTGGSVDNSGQDFITLFGKKDSVLKAKSQLQTHLKELETTEERMITISQKWQSHFTQRRAQLINDISAEFGNILISFPSRNQPGDQVRLKGPLKFVELASRRLLEIVEELESQITMDVDIPVVHHRALIGQNGQTVRDIQEQYKVNIKFPPAQSADRGFSATTNGDFYSAEFGHGSTEFDYNNATDGVDAAAASFDYASTIQISGSPANCQLAKQALLSLVPVEQELPLAHDYHGFLIGPKGQEIARLQREYGVQIRIPRLPANPNTCVVEEELDSSSGGPAPALDYITVKATAERVDKFREALDKLVQKWDEEKQDRLARSFELEVLLPADLPVRNLTSGRRLQFISDLMTQYEVFIQINNPRSSPPTKRTADAEEDPENHQEEGSELENIRVEVEESPDPAPSNQQRVIIRGYQKNAEQARDALLKRVTQLKQFTSAELSLPYEIHNRLIGTRGRNLARLIAEYEVDDISFPAQGAPDRDQVVVTGLPDNVDRACDALIDLANEFMEKYEERKIHESSRAPVVAPSSFVSTQTQQEVNWVPQQGTSNKNTNLKGFQVTGAPWQRGGKVNGNDRKVVAPDTNCSSEFPAIGGFNE